MRVVNGGEELDVEYEYLEESISRYVKVYKTFLVWQNNLKAI